MPSKLEQVAEHIAHLSPGAKVTVRGLAEDLAISEGTAYRGIKLAEDQGLVITKPKSGTVRVSLQSASDGGAASLAEAARSVGAVCLCGAEAALRKPMPGILIGDGSPEQLRNLIRLSSGPVLCMVGDRPKLHAVAIKQKTDLFLTGGAALQPELLRDAAAAGLSVFASGQDSSTLLGMLRRSLPEIQPSREMSFVRDWMQLPRYLYHDDMVTEWHHLYSDIFFQGSDCAVVDDSLQICGTVDAMTAMNALPALRLHEIMDPPGADSIISEDMTMEELADRFLRGHRIFSAVNSPEGLSGYIALSDVIRYYQYHMTYRSFVQNDEGILRRNDEGPDSNENSRFYTVKIRAPREETNRSLYINFLCSAASWHAYDLLKAPVKFESGTFFSPASLADPGEYTISSEIVKRTSDGLVFEVELFDNFRTYLKGTMNVSRV